MSGNSNLTIRIDTKYSRICVHKNTLEAIGFPEFIRLGYEPNSKQIMVLGVGSDMYKAIRVCFTTGGSFYSHCRRLIRTLRLSSQVLEEEGSYVLNGVLRAEEPAAIFPLRGAQVASTGAAPAPDRPA